MKQLIRILFLLILTGSVIGLQSSCAEESDCSMMGRPLMHCTLYSINPQTQHIRKDTLDSLTVLAVGTDSVILNNQKNVHTLSLPLRYNADVTGLIFQYAPNTSPSYVDTVYIYHTNTPFFQSTDCGYLMKQAIDSVIVRSRRLPEEPLHIDAVEITNNEANIYGNQNLQLFYSFR